VFTFIVSKIVLSSFVVKKLLKYALNCRETQPVGSDMTVIVEALALKAFDDKAIAQRDASTHRNHSLKYLTML